MTTIKLYGFPRSSCTRRVAIIAKERNIPYTYIPVDLTKGEQKHASFCEHQPFGQVPYITQDDGFELYESRAIGRYLATIGSGPELVPTEPRALAKFEQAASVEYAQLAPIATSIVFEKFIKPHIGQETNEGLLNELIPRIQIKLEAYEVILGKQKYLAGDEVTLADLYHLPYLNVIFEDLKLGLDGRPNLQRWWNDISSRPSWGALKNWV